MLLEGLVGEREVGLVERHRDGDASAFAELYERYYPRLLRFCRRRVRDSFTAEELAQDAFMRAYAAFGRLDDESRFYPWLTVIAKRLIIDDYRRSGRTVPSANLDPGTVEDASSGLLAEASQQELWKALDRVPGRHQEVLRLRDVEGLSYDAIAERLGTPATTVPPLLHRARKALRREYLALTAAERALAAPSVTVGMWLALRRTRDRVMNALSYISDPQTVTAPVTLSFVVAALIGSVSGAPGMPEASHGPESVSSAAESSIEDGRALLAPFGSQVRPAGAGAGQDPELRGMGAGRARLSLGERDRDAMRERARRMPLHIEHGDTWVGVDPNAGRDAVTSTLAGDLDWMR